MAEGKLTYQHTNSQHSHEPARKRRREVIRTERVTSVAQHFKPADLSSVKQVRNSQLQINIRPQITQIMFRVVVIIAFEPLPELQNIGPSLFLEVLSDRDRSGWENVESLLTDGSKKNERKKSPLPFPPPPPQEKKK